MTPTHVLTIIFESGNVRIPLRGESDIFHVKKSLDEILSDNDKGLPPFSFGRATHRFVFSAQYGNTPNSELLHSSIPAHIISGYFINPIQQTYLVQPTPSSDEDEVASLMSKSFAN